MDLTDDGAHEMNEFTAPEELLRHGPCVVESSRTSHSAAWEIEEAWPDTGVVS